jgi:hypothetical protein
MPRDVQIIKSPDQAKYIDSRSRDNVNLEASEASSDDEDEEDNPIDFAKLERRLLSANGQGDSVIKELFKFCTSMQRKINNLEREVRRLAVK